MLFNGPITFEKSKILIFTQLLYEMFKTKIFHLIIISLIGSIKITNAKENSDEQFGRRSWSRPAAVNRQLVNESYFLDGNDLFKTMSTTTLATNTLSTPYSTSHKPFIPSSSSTTQITSIRTRSLSLPQKTSAVAIENFDFVLVRNMIELEERAPEKCIQGGQMDTFYFQLENKSRLFRKNNGLKEQS